MKKSFNVDLPLQEVLNAEAIQLLNTWTAEFVVSSVQRALQPYAGHMHCCYML